jgi:hypothetical protein
MKAVKEIWKPVLFNGKKSNVPYRVSNFGNIAILEGKKLVAKKYAATKKGTRIRMRFGGNDLSIALSKIVATAFIPKKNNKQKFVICKDYNYSNCAVPNLKWATPEEHRNFIKNSPNNVKARLKKNYDKKKKGLVLKTKEVIALKEQIWAKKRKKSLKELASKYGVSEMQIYRIKRGEIWFHVKVKNEPDTLKYLSYIKHKSSKKNK